MRILYEARPDRAATRPTVGDQHLPGSAPGHQADQPNGV